MSNYKVLSINTYGGSLLVAAKLAGLEVVASLEDAGYGSDLQALNFPDVPRFETLAEWPDKIGHRWNQTVVIAHPPCAAFSNQNQVKSKRGTETSAFGCHVSVLEYALGHGCAALAIESVIGALTHAKEVYEAQAAKHRYQVFFVLQNAASFGVPQWRPRFWAWFLKRKKIYVGLEPVYKTLGDILQRKGKTPVDQASYLAKVRSRMGGVVTDEWSGNYLACIEKELGLKRESNYMNVRKETGTIGYFACCLPRFILPHEFASTVLQDSWFWSQNRELYQEEYCLIAGFPKDYKWGPRDKRFREYLSKGIAPPVGQWVLRQLINNLEQDETLTDNPHKVLPGEVLNLQPKKAEAMAAYQLAQKRGKR